MSWFGMKGISNGNPEDLIERTQENQRTMKRKDFNMSNLDISKGSSLLERRKIIASK
jgi:hypothetical protein